MRILKILIASFLTHMMFPIFSVLGFYLYGYDFGTSLGYSYTISLGLFVFGIALFVLFIIFGGILINLWTWATKR